MFKPNRNFIFAFIFVFIISLQSIALAGTIELPQTGQTTVYATGDDGDIEAGVAWPSPRFTDNEDSTMTDNLTGFNVDTRCQPARWWKDLAGCP